MCTGKGQQPFWRRCATAVGGLLLCGVLLTGCGEEPTTTMDAGPVVATPQRETVNRLNYSELGISMTVPGGLRVSARSPEDHELRLVGRAGEYQAVMGRMTLITRTDARAVLRDALDAIGDTWNRTLFNEQLNPVSDLRTEAIDNFHPPRLNGLTIEKKRMAAVKPLPTVRDPDLIDNEPNEVRILALAYVVAVQPIEAAAGNGGGNPAGATPSREKYMLAIFVLENTPESERMVDEMIKSVRNMQ